MFAVNRNCQVDGCSERRRLEHRWLATCDERDRVAYRSCCRTTNSLINQSHNNHFQKRLAECADDPKKRWHVVGELLYSKNLDSACSNADNSELCRTFSEFFVSKISTLESSIYCQLARFTPQFCDNPCLSPILDYLPPVTSAEVHKLLISRTVKSSFIDFIPPTLNKSCPGVFSELTAFLTSLSFSQGCFHSRFRHASVTPLLKQPSLDKLLPSKYRPISNLINISKLLVRLFLNRIQSQILSPLHFNSYQSAYRSNHSTETAILRTLDHIYHSCDLGRSTVLVSLDLSAAFDTVDHSILFNRLKASFGLWHCLGLA